MVVCKIKSDCVMQDTPIFLLDKLGPGCVDDSLQLADAMVVQAVKAHTSIPIPVVTGRGIDPATGHSYVGIQDANGSTSFAFSLEETWDILNEDQKESITEQLRKYTAQLRALNPDAVPATPFLKDRFFWPRCRDGEFHYRRVDTDHEFVEQLIQTLSRTTAVYEPSWTAQVAMMLKALPTGERLVFSHGNLVPSNIYIDGSARIVAVLDWSQAGFYPVFWEYAKAHFWDWESPFIQDGQVDKILKPYPLHLAALYHAKDLIW